MKSKKNKTLMFMGAGATANLMGATSALGDIIFQLLCKNDEFNKRTDILEEHKKAFTTLTDILEKTKSSGTIDLKSEEYKAKYDIDKEKVKENLGKLKESFDIDCLKAFINSMTPNDGNKVDIMTLYTTIDLLIREQGGFNYNKSFYDLLRVRAARNLLNLLTHLVLLCQSEFALKNKTEVVAEYKEFIDALVELTRIESIDLSNKRTEYTDPDFINFSYSIVSFNWEPLFLGLIFSAHKSFNHSYKVPYLGERCLKLRLFNDFGTIIGSLRKDKRDELAKVWYQGHESIAIRVNDSEFPSRLMRVGKILYPHGCFAFRMCPVCRKTNFVVKNVDETINFFGPGILPEFNDFFSKGLLTKKEEEKFREGIFDGLECYSCGNITRMIDTPLIMQTAYKNLYTPLQEEALYDLTVQLKNANHLIFNGFKCSTDDIVYRSKVFASLAEESESKKKVSVVLLNSKLNTKKWYNREEVESILNQNVLDADKKKEISDFLALFPNKSNKLRFSFLGFPHVLKVGGSILNSTKDFLEFK